MNFWGNKILLVNNKGDCSRIFFGAGWLCCFQKGLYYHMVASQIVPKIDGDDDDSAVQETIPAPHEPEPADGAAVPTLQVQQRTSSRSGPKHEFTSLHHTREQPGDTLKS